ncbi:MAG: hypothetical protein JEZ09_03890 [Salinivirgaceae bacterium]|nr:hypothetical protein [Salinivirgaceae bacterium]
MGVLMQAFYWDCPRVANQEFKWWKHVKEKIPQLKNSGITALWLPPACKAQDVISMGYDPSDFYDLGEFQQKHHDGKETWYGSKDDLLSLIRTAHNEDMQVLADLVFNHCSGGELEENPHTGDKWYTKFSPKSGKFERDYDSFHPSVYESYDGSTFGGYSKTDLCHRNPLIYKEILDYCKWLIEEIGFDGFRYDCVKGYGGWMTKSIQEMRYKVSNDFSEYYKPFGVGELWDDNDQTIEYWLNEINNFSDNPVSAFDFPLRSKLRKLCLDKEYDLRDLAYWNNTLLDRPYNAVTFVENHDTCWPHPDVSDKEIFADKMLAYSFILTHPGYPCVFWQDYFNFDLAQSENNSGIDALISAHEKYAGGDADVLYADSGLYIMQRRGFNDKKGLVYVLNKNEGRWAGKCVKTQWENCSFKPVAWRGNNDSNSPQDAKTYNFWGEFWAPSRGYAVYAVE